MVELGDIPGKILIQGDNLRRTKPSGDILKALRSMGIHQLNPLQERIIAGLHSGSDVFVAAPRNEGKTTAYLIPTLNYVLDEITNLDKTERCNAPSMMIVCGETSSAMAIESLINELLSHFDRDGLKAHIVLFDDVFETLKLEQLNNGVDIFLLTAPGLQRLIKRGFSQLANLKLNYQRLRYLIFEETGMEAYQFAEEMVGLLRFLRILSNDKPLLHASPPPSLQLIFCGSVWHRATNEFYKMFQALSRRKIVTILGSLCHALQYGKVQTKVHFGDETAKLKTAIDICKDMLLQNATTVISCSTSEVAEKVSLYFKREGINNALHVDDQRTSEIPQFDIFNKKRVIKVFVVSDDALESFKPTEPRCLIHFDCVSSEEGDEAPLNHRRYACIWNRINRKSNPELTVFVMLTGEESNLIALYKFMKATKAFVPQPLKDIANRLIETEMLKQPICPSTKCIGFCNKFALGNCTYRHNVCLDDLVEIPDLPQHGELEFIVTQCINPSLYMIRMLKHFVFQDGKRICDKSFEKDFTQRQTMMTDYFEIKQKCVTPAQVVAGNIVCFPSIKMEDTHYKIEEAFVRVRIVKLVPPRDATTSGSSLVQRANVVFVDYGISSTVNVQDLLEIPPEFENWSAHGMQLVLSNLLPPASKVEYFATGVKEARCITENHVWHGKVLLSVGSTIWVNPMVEFVEDPVTGHIVKGRNLRTELIRLGHADTMDHHKHMSIILGLVRDAKPDFPDIPHELNSYGLGAVNQFWKEDDFHRPGEEIHWTSLELSTIEPDFHIAAMPITIYSWRNPWEIYGTVAFLQGNDGCSVTHLEMDMTEEIEKILPRIMEGCGKPPFYVPGAILAVKSESSNMWQRGMLLQRDGEDELLNIFLVDYGKCVSNVLPEDTMPILRKFVCMLHFQAVCLKLAHVHPTQGGDFWSGSEVEKFGALMTQEENYIINVAAFSKARGSGNGSCNYYDVITFHTQAFLDSGGKCGEEIENQLVDSGNAFIASSSRCILSLLKRVYYDDTFRRSIRAEEPERSHTFVYDDADSNSGALDTGILGDENADSNSGCDCDDDKDNNENETMAKFLDDYSHDDDTVDGPGPSVKELRQMQLSVEDLGFGSEPSVERQLEKMTVDNVNTTLFSSDEVDDDFFDALSDGSF